MPSRHSRFVFLLLVLQALLVAACGATDIQRGGDDDDQAPWDDDDGSDDDDAADDDDSQPAVESDCGDGVDNDGDGFIDCEDSDCDEQAPCTWPESIVHTGDFQFDGADIECEILGQPFPFSVDDCRTAYSSTLGPDLTFPPCEACDRTFEGPFTYSVDSCAELLDSESPSLGAFGLNFLSDTAWEFYALDAETGVWDLAGSASDDGSGTYVFTASEPIVGNPEECGVPDEQTLGVLSVTLTFADAGR